MYCVTGAWYGVLSVISTLAVVTNALLIATTSNFVSFEVYIRGDYDEYDGNIVPSDAVRRGLSGYARWSTTAFNISDLLDGFAFPAYTAQELEYVSDDGDSVHIISNNGSRGTPLYLPFINFTCLQENVDNCSEILFTTVRVTRYTGEDTNDTTFTDKQYQKFYDRQECRDLILGVNKDDSADDIDKGGCFNSNLQCRCVLTVYVIVYL